MRRLAVSIAACTALLAARPVAAEEAAAGHAGHHPNHLAIAPGAVRVEGATGPSIGVDLESRIGRGLGMVVLVDVARLHELTHVLAGAARCPHGPAGAVTQWVSVPEFNRDLARTRATQWVTSPRASF